MKLFLLFPLLLALTSDPSMTAWKMPTKDPAEKRYISMVMRDGNLFSKIVIDYGCGKPLALVMRGGYMAHHQKSGEVLMYALSDEMDIGGGCKVENMLIVSGKFSSDFKYFDAKAFIISSCKCKDKSKDRITEDDVGGRWVRVHP